MCVCACVRACSRWSLFALLTVSIERKRARGPPFKGHLWFLQNCANSIMGRLGSEFHPALSLELTGNRDNTVQLFLQAITTDCTHTHTFELCECVCVYIRNTNLRIEFIGQMAFRCISAKTCYTGDLLDYRCHGNSFSLGNVDTHTDLSRTQLIWTSSLRRSGPDVPC